MADAGAKELSADTVLITRPGINLASLAREAAVNQRLLEIRSAPLSSCSKIKPESQTARKGARKTLAKKKKKKAAAVCWV